MNRLMTWELWLRGLVASFIGGGASAVTSTLSANLIAPDKFNLTNQLGHFLELAGVTFLINGFVSLFFFLKQSPLPEVTSVTVTTATTGTTTTVEQSVTKSDKPAELPKP